MPTIVRHNPTGDHYILIGAGYGKWASARPNRLLGDLFASDKSGETRLVCLCDADGKVEWAFDKHITVVSVDNQSPADTLAPYQTREPIEDDAN